MKKHINTWYVVWISFNDILMKYDDLLLSQKEVRTLLRKYNVYDCGFQVKRYAFGIGEDVTNKFKRKKRK